MLPHDVILPLQVEERYSLQVEVVASAVVAVGIVLNLNPKKKLWMEILILSQLFNGLQILHRAKHNNISGSLFEKWYFSVSLGSKCLGGRWPSSANNLFPRRVKSQESSSFLLGTARFDCCHAVDQGSNSNLVHHFEINMFLTMLNSWIIKKGKLELLEGPPRCTSSAKSSFSTKVAITPWKDRFLRGIGEGPITSTITPTCGNKTSKIQDCWKKNPQNKVAKKKQFNFPRTETLCLHCFFVPY